VLATWKVRFVRPPAVAASRPALASAAVAQPRPQATGVLGRAKGPGLGVTGGLPAEKLHQARRDKAADGDPVVFAGIWEEWRSPEGEVLHTFSTITTDANRQLAAIQDRMPVILEKVDWPIWLGEVEGDVPALLRPLPENVLRIWPVDKRVGNVKNDGPELLLRNVPEEAPALL
jgi:hypothetical protein